MMSTLRELMARHQQDSNDGTRRPGPPVLIAAAEREASDDQAPDDLRGARRWSTLLVDMGGLLNSRPETSHVDTVEALQPLVSEESEVFPLEKAGHNPSPNICIGRAKRNDVVVTDVTISSQHAVIEQVGSGWVLVDQNSSNGTFVNKRRLEVAEQVPLRSGDCVRLGERVFFFMSSQELFDLLAQRIEISTD